MWYKCSIIILIIDWQSCERLGKYTSPVTDRGMYQSYS